MTEPTGWASFISTFPHRGVGTGVLGPDVRPEHRLTELHYSWRWRLHLTPTFA
jgi:hypothetical protein